METNMTGKIGAQRAAILDEIRRQFDRLSEGKEKISFCSRSDALDGLAGYILAFATNDEGYEMSFDIYKLFLKDGEVHFVANACSVDDTTDYWDDSEYEGSFKHGHFSTDTLAEICDKLSSLNPEDLGEDDEDED